MLTGLLAVCEGQMGYGRCNIHRSFQRQQAQRYLPILPVCPRINIDVDPGPGQFTFKHSGNRQEGSYEAKVFAEGEEPDPDAPPLEPQWKGGKTCAVRSETNLWHKM